MLDFKGRTRIRRALYAKPTIIVLLLAFFFAAHSAWGMYQKSVEAVAKRDGAEQKRDELAAREKTLSEDIVNLSTDRGVEAEIRDRFMVAKEGEHVFVITDPDAQKTHTVMVTDEHPSMMKRMLGSIGISN